MGVARIVLVDSATTGSASAEARMKDKHRHPDQSGTVSELRSRMSATHTNNHPRRYTCSFRL